MRAEPSDLIKEAKQRFTRCDEAESRQRASIALAKAFRAGDQWPDEIKIQRQGGASIPGQAAQPQRPCLTIDRLSQPVRQISNQIKTANFAIDVLPNGSGADTETAEIFKGIIRRVQNLARADSPIEWAADQAIEGGIGWFRIRSDYVHESANGVPLDALADQELRLERILNNLSVYCDPSAVKPTKSDARFMFVTEWLTKDEFERRFGEKPTATLDEFVSLGDTDQKWMEENRVRIAEYWRVLDETSYLVKAADGMLSVQTKKPGKDDGALVREIRRPVVKCSIINALEELQAFDWPGLRIPLVPILGEELNVDGQAILRGIISEGMDAQRMVNYMYSAAIETVALAPKAPLIVADGQLDQYKAIWQNANRFNYAYLPYKPIALGGTPIPPPQRDNTEPAIQAMVAMLMKSEEAIKATTGIWEESLGHTKQEKSGRAIQALQGQSELGSSNYPDNVRRALIYAGEILVDVLPKITRKGQILTILGVDDQPEQIMVGQPFAAQPGQSPQPVNVDPELLKQQKGIAKFYDLGAGKYAVTVDVGKSHTTKREEGAQALGDLIGHIPPELAAPMVPEYIEQLSFPGAHKIAEAVRRALPPHLRGPEEGEEPIPAKAQQEMAQMQQALQQLQQVAQEQQRALDADSIKTQGNIKIKEIQEAGEQQRTQWQLALEAQKEDVKLQVERLKLDVEMRKLEVELEIEMAKLGSAQSLARGELEQQALHEHNAMQLATEERQSAEAQATLDREHEAAQAEASRQQQPEAGA